MSTIIQTLTNGCRKGVATLVRVGHRNRYLLAVVTASALSTGTLMATAPKHDPRVVEEHRCYLCC